MLYSPYNNSIKYNNNKIESTSNQITHANYNTATKRCQNHNNYNK